MIENVESLGPNSAENLREPLPLGYDISSIHTDRPWKSLVRVAEGAERRRRQNGTALYPAAERAERRDSVAADVQVGLFTAMSDAVKSAPVSWIDSVAVQRCSAGRVAAIADSVTAVMRSPGILAPASDCGRPTFGAIIRLKSPYSPKRSHVLLPRPLPASRWLGKAQDPSALGAENAVDLPAFQQAVYPATEGKL